MLNLGTAQRCTDAAICASAVIAAAGRSWLRERGARRAGRPAADSRLDQRQKSQQRLAPGAATVVESLAPRPAIWVSCVAISAVSRPTVSASSCSDDGRTSYRATRTVYRLVFLGGEAPTSKGELQLKASELADRLVSPALSLPLVTHLATGDWRRAAAVFQADHFCALKLAIPVAFKAAMARSRGAAGVLDLRGLGHWSALLPWIPWCSTKRAHSPPARLAVTDTLVCGGGLSPGVLLSHGCIHRGAQRAPSRPGRGGGRLRSRLPPLPSQRSGIHRCPCGGSHYPGREGCGGIPPLHGGKRWLRRQRAPGGDRRAGMGG